jgi:hypothetical protein
VEGGHHFVKIVPRGHAIRQNVVIRKLILRCRDLRAQVGDLLGKGDFDRFAALALLDLGLQALDFLNGLVDLLSEDADEEGLVSNLTAP